MINKLDVCYLLENEVFNVEFIIRVKKQTIPFKTLQVNLHLKFETPKKSRCHGI